MIRWYKYFFYRLYRWAIDLKLDQTPEISAFAVTVIVVWWNLLSLANLLELVFSKRLFPPLSIPSILAMGAIIALPQYFILIHRGRHKLMFNEFASEGPRQVVTRGVLIGIFIPASFILMIVTAVLGRAHGIK